MNADRPRLAMNSTPLLNSDALRRILLNGQIRLPLTHTRALEVIACLHGYRTWNAAAASASDVSGLKQRAKVLRSQLPTGTQASSFATPDLDRVCAAMNAVLLGAPVVSADPSLPDDLTALDRELLGLLGAGASTAELRHLLPERQRELSFDLIGLGAKVGRFGDPSRDAYAREIGLVLHEHKVRLAALRQARPRQAYIPSDLNLAASPSLADFQRLVAAQDDERGHHILWVDREGWIHLDILPDKMAPVQYEEEIDCDMQFRYETFVEGCGNVGRTAAKDSRRMAQILESLKHNWNQGAVGYIEVF